MQQILTELHVISMIVQENMQIVFLKVCFCLESREFYYLHFVILRMELNYVMIMVDHYCHGDR